MSGWTRLGIVASVLWMIASAATGTIGSQLKNATPGRLPMNWPGIVALTLRAAPGRRHRTGPGLRGRGLESERRVMDG
jgi:hypothetical protein